MERKLQIEKRNANGVTKKGRKKKEKEEKGTVRN